jgi:hypothetical protein
VLGGGVLGAGFDVLGDTRQFAAKNFHDTIGCRNVSTSVDHDGMVCIACLPPHSYNDYLSVGEPVVIVCADQSFPPVLPAGGGKCVAIVRVEDGRLFEIENAFRDIFVKNLAPNGRLPHGSVVLVGSVSHLCRYGLESYAGDLAKTMSLVAAVAGDGVNVIPLVPVPLGGVGGPTSVRSLFDFDAWLIGSARGPGESLEKTRKKFWELVAASGGGGEVRSVMAAVPITSLAASTIPGRDRSLLRRPSPLYLL